MSLENASIEEYLRYLIEIFWSDEDECFIANVPDIKYCSAHGDTPEEALKEIKIALQAALEAMKEKGIEFPKPRKKE